MDPMCAGLHAVIIVLLGVVARRDVHELVQFLRRILGPRRKGG